MAFGSPEQTRQIEAEAAESAQKLDELVEPMSPDTLKRTVELMAANTRNSLYLALSAVERDRDAS